MSYRTISAMTGERGEPMGMPKICLYVMLLKSVYMLCYWTRNT